MLDQFRVIAVSAPAKILLVLLVLSFAVWGVGDMVRHPGRNFTVATVGNVNISSDEFTRNLRRATDNARQSLGNQYTPELLKSLDLPQAVLKQMVGRTLVRVEAESLGLVPGDADVVRRIRANPAFQDSKGNFDKSIFESMLTHTGQSEKAYVEEQRQEVGSALLMDTLLSTAPVSGEAVRRLLASRDEQRQATFYVLGPSLVSGIGEPDDAQVETYYKEHKGDFTAPEYRTLSYVILTAGEAHSSTVSEEELKAAYNERIEDFKHPERRTVEQLLYASEDKAKKAEELLKGGKSVADVAKTTDTLNRNVVSLGKVEKGKILENAAEAVFSLPVGGITEPIQSPFGWHIFHVSAIEEPATAPFEEVRPQLEKDLKQHGGDASLNQLANKLEDTLAGGATLAEAAKELSLKVHTLPPVTAQGITAEGEKVKDIPDTDKFLEAAFKTQEKNESPVLTAPGGLYYLVHVEKVTPEKLRLLGDVQVQAAAGWQKEEREKRLSALADDISKKMSDAKTREAAISTYHLSPSASGDVKRDSHTLGEFSLPPALVTDLFEHAPGEATAAHPLKNGGYAVAVVDKIVSAPENSGSDKERAEMRRQLESDVQNELLGEYTHYLAGKYRVSVNEAVLEAITK